MGGLTEDERAAIERAAAAAVAYRESVPDRPVPAQDPLDGVVARFRTPLAEEGQQADRVIEDMVRSAEGGICHMSSPSFHGYVLGGSHPAGVAADMLVSAWGQNTASSLETPAMTGMERAVCDWVIDLLGLPPDSGAGLVTGATVANTEGIMAARHALLARRNWDVETNGLFGAPEIPVLISDAAHSAPFAGLRYAGLGAGRAVRVKADDQGRIDPQAFEAALSEVKAPPLVILQAGQINTGAFDPFAELIPMVRAREGWVHIDGAFGLWLMAVPELRDRLRGVETADSWATDLHKWLNAPFDAGMVIVRDRAPLVASMTARGAYLPDESDHWEPTDSTVELSRRARGVPSYAIFRHLGRAGVRELVARHCRLAAWIAERLAAEPGIEVLNAPHCNQVSFACGGSDEATARVLGIVQRRGRVYPTRGEWLGRSIIRVSVIGYATQDMHADALVEEVISAWREVQGI